MIGVKIGDGVIVVDLRNRRAVQIDVGLDEAALRRGLSDEIAVLIVV